MKEDILEQLVEDWLVSQEGCFAKHNIKLLPLSEIVDDIMARINLKETPVLENTDMVVYYSC